jgi:hypothetical protein
MNGRFNFRDPFAFAGSLVARALLLRSSMAAESPRLERSVSGLLASFDAASAARHRKRASLGSDTAVLPSAFARAASSRRRRRARRVLTRRGARAQASRARCAARARRGARGARLRHSRECPPPRRACA